MTTPLTRSEGESSSAAALISKGYSAYVQLKEADGSLRLVQRQSTQPTAAATLCRVIHVTPVSHDEGRENFDQFDAFAEEIAQDQKASALVSDGRRWIAEAYGEETLASLRLAAGLSQSQLAAACGIEQPHVSRYELGKHEPSLTVSRAMSSALGVSMEAFHEAWLKSRAANERTAK